MNNQADSWPARHFSLANPAGPGRDDIPRLLRSLADDLERRQEIEIQNIFCWTEIDDDGERCPTATVYFRDTADS